MMLTRDQLAEVFKNHQTLRAFEKAMSNVDGVLPTTIEEANALAASALAVAQTAIAALSVISESLSQFEGAPATLPNLDPDDTAIRVQLGTISEQNADSVEIIGGSIDGTPIGATTASTAKFTTISASGQITSTVATGTAPLVVASTTKVANLNVDLLDDKDWAAPAAIGTTTPAAGTFTDLTATGKFGCNGKAAQASASLGVAATDLSTVITLANNIRAALIANGIGA